MSAFDFILFEGADFTGKRLHVRRSWDFCLPFPQVPCGFDADPDLRRIYANDRFSSVIVHEGYLALFEHVNFGGEVRFFEPGEASNSLAAEGFNHMVSSWIAGDRPFGRQEMLLIRGAFSPVARY